MIVIIMEISKLPSTIINILVFKSKSRLPQAQMAGRGGAAVAAVK